jgi:two-component sensor histidine kinase
LWRRVINGFSFVGAIGGRLRGRPWLGYGLAIATTGAALGVRLSLSGWFAQEYPFTTLFLAVIATAFVAGQRPGIASVLLSAAAAWYFILRPTDQYGLDQHNAVGMAIFLVVALAQVALIVTMQNRLDSLLDQRQQTAHLHDQQRLLYQELQHRVANNMAFISSLLRLQKRRLADNPAAAPKAFDEAVARIDTMSRVHRRLYDPAAANRALDGHIQAMCDELLVATGSTGVSINVALPGLRLDLDKQLPVSLLIAELVTNSLKHGFVGRAGGAIMVGLEPSSAGETVVLVRDDGIGLPAGLDATPGPGLGMRIIHGLGAQVGARIAMASDGGTTARIHITH